MNKSGFIGMMIGFALAALMIALGVPWQVRIAVYLTAAAAAVAVTAWAVRKS